LLTDQAYLEQLVDVDAAYLGVLGPPRRKQRLLEALAEKGERLRGRLRGPVGLDIGADSPEAIALSILAEMQASTTSFAGYPRTS
jgi:xanthine/CO dehydrogenase XdhC/CoxF family maturation factor